LKTITLALTGPKGSEKFRCLLDAGSHRSYITSKASTALGLSKIDQERLKISGFGGRSSTKNLPLVNVGLGSEIGGQPFIILSCLETNRICDPIPFVPNGPWTESMKARHLNLAEDPSQSKGGATWKGEIDLLIGTEHYYRVLTGAQIRLTQDLLAVESIFGWFVHGAVCTSDEQQDQTIALLIRAQEEESERPETMLSRLFDLDGVHEQEDDAQAQLEADPVMMHFKSTVTKRGDRYCVKLPWKEHQEELPSNEGPAIQQAQSLIQRLKRSPKTLKSYHELILDHLKRGFIEEVLGEDPKSWNRILHYIPHHAVIRMDKVSTKIRQVFNASFGSPSLNDLLNSGPNLVPPMQDIVIRFRSRRVALVADMEKAFLQIEVDEGDRDVLRFIWVEDPTANLLKFKIFRWKRVVFGVTSSPFHLAAVIQHHLSLQDSEHPEVVRMLKWNCLVDDVIIGTENCVMGLKIAEEATEIAAKAGMPLRRWRTNDAELQESLAKLNQDERVEETMEFNNDQMKVLGTGWHRASDCLTFSTATLIEYCATVRHLSCLRTILSIAARVYDILGLISPVIITIRILMQNLWKLKLSWEEEVTDPVKKEFWSWVDQLNLLSTIKIPRWYHHGLPNKIENQQLHLFCDASTKAYGAVGYLRSEDEDGNVIISIVLSKVRVAPVKQITLPRLELLGGHVAVKVASAIKVALEIEQIETFYWTDSQASLAWIKGDPSRWQQYVSNRVRLIQERSNPAE
jgi:hypothetical protein